MVSAAASDVGQNREGSGDPGWGAHVPRQRNRPLEMVLGWREVTLVEGGEATESVRPNEYRPIGDPLREDQAALVQAGSAGEIALHHGEVAGTVQQRCAQVGGHVLADGKDLFHPPAPFAHRPAYAPQPMKRDCHSASHLGFPLFDRPTEHGPQIVVVRFESI